MFAVNVSIADLRSEPCPPDFKADIDRKQESQLLYGEVVQAAGKENELWVKVSAIEQTCFREATQWTGYPGWVLKSELIPLKDLPAKSSLVVVAPWVVPQNHTLCLPMGTYLEKIADEGTDWKVNLLGGLECQVSKEVVVPIPTSKDPKRAAMLLTARKLIGNRYTWGGRSPYLANWTSSFTSVDCSGLVNLVHRVHGIKIPRDAHDQYLVSEQITPIQLQPADLIFLAPTSRTPTRMNHVMFFMEGDHFIDSNIKDGVVISTGKERFDMPIAEMKNGQKVRSFSIQAQAQTEYQIFFGRIGQHA